MERFRRKGFMPAAVRSTDRDRGVWCEFAKDV